MPFSIKDSGTFHEFAKGDVQYKASSTWGIVNSLFIKDAGVWVPMWSDLPNFRYGYAPWAGAALDQAAGSANSTAFMNNVMTNLMPNNDDGQQLVADTSFQDDVTLYLFVAWPKDLGDIDITNENLSSPEVWPYSQETSAYATDGPSTPIEVTYDDGFGSKQWYVRRNDWPGAYDGVTTTYSFDFPSRP
jgi:hypothetical protein